MKNNTINLFKFLLLTIVFTLVTSCGGNESEEAPLEDEYFRLVVDNEEFDLTYVNFIDVTGDRSIYVSAGLYPDRYHITLVADELKGVGAVKAPENESSDGIGLYDFDEDVDESFDDSDTLNETEIKITRHDTYVEGNFSGIVKENFTSTPRTKIVSGTFKVRYNFGN